MSDIIMLNENNFSDEVLNANKLAVVDFYADWCMPCKMLTPILEELASENDDNVKIAKLNVDNAKDIAMKYGITSIPCVIFFKNGEEVSRVTGLRSKEDFQEQIQNFA